MVHGEIGSVRAQDSGEGEGKGRGRAWRMDSAWSAAAEARTAVQKGD